MALTIDQRTRTFTRTLLNFEGGLKPGKGTTSYGKEAG